MSRNMKILKIESISNPSLATTYVGKGNSLEERNEIMLWHGTDHDFIQKGFQMKHANINGYLGGGIYGAKSPLYSHNFIKNNNLNNVKKLLFVKFNLGKIFIGNEEYRHFGNFSAPDNYDSIFARVNNGSDDIYSVYDNAQTYITHVVTYQEII